MTRLVWKEEAGGDMVKHTYKARRNRKTGSSSLEYANTVKAFQAKIYKLGLKNFARDLSPNDLDAI
ncbi:hypothetical protein B0T13DRAFT_512939 [Neurospora crassa]|nr:hypothetical protein B0T13DRAFT_512939 [Neurospora crassa]